MLSVTNEALNEHAMQIILYAGEARNYINMALDALYECNEEEYEEKIKEARKASLAAHAEQTKVLQETIENQDMRLTILFTHAQDTLMTVMSEMNTAKHLAKIINMIKEKTHE